MEVTPAEINSQMINDITNVLAYLLPDGVKRGHELEAGSIAGDPGKSLKVRVEGSKAGVWADFSTGDKGDLIDLWCLARNVPFVDGLKEIKEYLGIDSSNPSIKFTKKTYIKPKLPKCIDPNAKMLKILGQRMIGAATIKKLRLKLEGKRVVYPFYSPEGELEMIKYRHLEEKKFGASANSVPCLFGWQSIPDTAEYVIITEGEIDQLTWTEQGFYSLSVPFGGGNQGKHEWIEHEYDRLNRFRYIYLSFEGDEAGLAARKDISSRLGIHRCKMIELGGTDDANSVHMGGARLDRYFEDAETKDPDELKCVSDFHEDTLAALNLTQDETPGLYLPWKKTESQFKFRLGDTTILAGINGHGKSEIVNHIIVDAISQGERFGIASLEMEARYLCGKLYRQAGWTRGCNFSSQIGEYFNDIFLYNKVGTGDLDQILESFIYARKRYGVKYFVIDSLSKCGIADDDYTAQKIAVEKIFDFSIKHLVHVILVVHIRKQKDELSIPTKFDIKGSGGMTDAVSNVLVVWRNKVKEAARRNGNQAKELEPDQVLRCVKQRSTGQETHVNLWFHAPSCQFLPERNDRPKQYVRYEQSRVPAPVV